jgi:hypothetical protein
VRLLGVEERDREHLPAGTVGEIHRSLEASHLFDERFDALVCLLHRVRGSVEVDTFERCDPGVHEDLSLVDDSRA